MGLVNGNYLYVMKGKFDIVTNDVSEDNLKSAVDNTKMKLKNMNLNFLGKEGGIKMSEDRKIFEMVTKEHLLDVIKESEVLRENHSPDEIIELGAWVSEMSYEDAVSMLMCGGCKLTQEQMRDYEGKTKKAAKYTAAAAVGAYAAKKLANRPDAPYLLSKKASNLQKAVDVAKRKIPNRVKGILRAKGPKKVGAIAAVGSLFLFRRLADPCWRKAALIMNPDKRREVKYQCQMAAIKKVMDSIKNQMNACDNASNPERCKSKLRKELAKWQKRYQEAGRNSRGK